MWDPRPAANAEVSPLKSTSFAPRSGLPRKYAVHATPLWEARPAAKGRSARSKHKPRPRVGPPTRNMQCTRHHCGIRDPRRMGRSAPSKHKLRPEVGAPTEICSARGAIVGGAPRGECGGLPAQKHKLRPGVGAPTRNMQCTRRAELADVDRVPAIERVLPKGLPKCPASSPRASCTPDTGH